MFIEFISGIFLAGILPVIFISQFVMPTDRKRQLQMGAVFSKKLAENISLLTLLTVSILSIFYQNSDILLGVLIGSCLFQLLVICGIDKINSSEERKFVFSLENIFKGNQEIDEKSRAVRYRSSGQFLVFSVILLLFLSADYLLPRGTSQNELSRVDGVLLMGTFVLYGYLMWGRKEKEEQTEEQNIGTTYIGKGIICLLILEIFIVAGNILLIRSVSRLGVKFEVPQYSMGLTLLAWCVNLSGIVLKQIIERREGFEKSTEYIQLSLEESMGRSVFSLTILLGAIAVIRPITIQMSQIYDLMIFAVIVLLVQIFRKVDNRLAGSGMAAIYVGCMIHILLR